MKNLRIIPRLDIKGANLVKGIHLEGLRVLGSPEDFAKYYYDNGADELIFQDVVASLYNRNSLHNIISRVAKNIFIPITVGGGIRTLNDIDEILRAGADRVCINSEALKNPKFIEKAVKTYGMSTILISIETIKNQDGKYYCFYDCGREESGLEIKSWIKKTIELGVGELLITSVDRDGTSLGYDIDLIKQVHSVSSIQFIPHGGASNFENILEVLKYTNSLAIGSAFHYHSYEHFINNITNHIEGDTSFLDSNIRFEKVITYSINMLKEFLAKKEFNIRLNA